MANELTIRLPALSNTMEHGEIIRWIVDEGDTVTEGQPIAEVVTDKVDMELESPYAGTVTGLLVEPGVEVAVGTPIAMIDSEEDDLLGGLDVDGDEAAPGQAAHAVPDAQPPAPEEDHADDGGPRVLAPPPLRFRAKRLGVDLRDVPATGKRGQVTPDDLERYLAEREDAGEAEPAAPAARAAPAAKTPRPAPSGARASGDRRASMRAATARVMTRSAAVPQFVLFRRVDLTEARQRKGGRSWTTEIARAVAHGVREHPQLGGSWNEEEERLELSYRIRVGLAVDREDGLIVVGVDDPSMGAPDDVDQRVRAAVDRARRGDLTPADTSDITITVSNLGGLEIDRFVALVVPPQTAILSVGRVNEVPLVVDGRIRPRLCVELGLTVDHRAADGADAARFLKSVAEHLEG